MSRRRRTPRLQLSLAPAELEQLAEVARRSGLPRATTATRIIRTSLANQAPSLDAAVGDGPKRQRPMRAGTSTRAPWLPPSSHVDAIDRLRESFPFELRDLHGIPTATLLTDKSIATRLSALAHWRGRIETGEFTDSRVEIAFTKELDLLTRWLRERRFRPNRASGGR